MPPCESLRGSGDPNRACAWPTARRPSSPVLALMGLWQGGGQPSVAIPFAEDLEHRDWVFPGGKLGVDIVGQAECVPARPMLVHYIGALFRNSGPDAFIDKAEIRAQRIGLRRWQSIQVRLCG
jgi:hypothetical protein